VEIDAHIERITGLAGDQGLWSRASQTMWPAIERFGAWSSIAGSLTKIDRIRRLAEQRSCGGSDAL